MGSSLFALGLGLRAAVVGGIAFVAVWLLSLGHYYATVVVLAGVAALVLADMARRIAKADRMLERFVDGFAIDEFEKPAFTTGRYSGFRRLMDAIDRRGAAANTARAIRQRHSDYLQTLTDNVAVALLVVEQDGSIVLANRAARRLAGRTVHRLSEIGPIGEAEAAALLALPAGQRAILRLTNGQRVLASAARFSADGADRRLLSLQNVESELDAVELKAWQDLVRVLSHEMMNSLTPISSLAESIRPLAENLNVNDGRAEDIKIAVEAIARRSAGLLNFVERYRKIAGMPRPNLQRLELAELMRRIDHLIGQTLTGRGIACKMRVEPGDLSVMADADLLEQAIINLLHNAADAVNEAPDPRIEVTFTMNDEERVAIAVADNGCGLDAASLDRIFVPFFTTKPNGSGIGLSFSRQIAMAHHGQIKVSQNRPNGAVFTIVLPGFRAEP